MQALYLSAHRNAWQNSFKEIYCWTNKWDKNSIKEVEELKNTIDLKIENKTGMLLSEIANITANLERNIVKNDENATNINEKNIWNYKKSRILLSI